jgi:predicted transcriptional regulator
MIVMFPVKDYMMREIATIDSGASALDASKMMKDKNTGYLIVLEKAQPAGILTHGDIVTKVTANNMDPSKTRISEVMSAPLITVDPDIAVNEAVKFMVEHDIRRLPVVRDNIIYGVFRARDLIRHFDEYTEKVTKDIIRSVTRWPL